MSDTNEPDLSFLLDPTEDHATLLGCAKLAAARWRGIGDAHTNDIEANPAGQIAHDQAVAWDRIVAELENMPKRLARFNRLGNTCDVTETGR